MNKLAPILMIFIAALDTTALATVLPHIISQLGDMQLYPFINAAFLLTYVIATPIFGTIADRLSCKHAAGLSMAFFLVGSIFSGLAGSMKQLIAWRLLQGVGAGGLVNTSFVMSAKMNELDSDRAKMQGLLSVVWAFSSIFGPIIGALITITSSWRWVFFINIPIGLIALLFLRKQEEKSIPQPNEAFDFAGTILFTVANFALFFGLIDISQGSEAISAACLTTAAIVFGLFVLRSFSIPSPLLPLGLLRYPLIVVCMYFAMLTGFCLTCANSLVALYIQGSMRESLAFTGLAVAALSFGWAAGSYACGFLYSEWGIRKVSFFAVSFLIVGFIFLGIAIPSVSIIYFLVVNFVIGAGMGAMVNSSQVAVQRAVSLMSLGRATSFLSLIRAAGAGIGYAASGMLQMFLFKVYLVAQSDAFANPKVAKTLIQAPNTFLELSFGKGMNPSDFKALCLIFGSSIQTVFMVPAVLLVCSAPLLIYLPIKEK